MPYIATEQVKEIRNELKRQFPEIKFSVSRQDSSMVCVALMESPYKWNADHHQINEFYLEDYPNADVLKRICKIVRNGQRTLVYDQDYGAVPTYYISLTVGKWDKPHVQTH